MCTLLLSSRVSPFCATKFDTSVGELIEFTGRNRPEVAMLSMEVNLINSTPSADLAEGISKMTVNFQMAFFPPGARLSKTFRPVP